MQVSRAIQEAFLGLQNSGNRFEGVQYPQGIEPNADVNCGAPLLHGADGAFRYAQTLGKDRHRVIALQASFAEAQAQLL